MPKKSKQKVLKELSAKKYKIYGIFDFQEEVLVYVHMKLEQVELEFDLEGYDSERFDVVSFDICLL